MKIKEVLSEKLVNFRVFIIEQCCNANIEKKKINKIVDELDGYMVNMNLFIEILILLSGFDAETAVKLYLGTNEINFDEIKDKIDKDKLIRYIEFFCSLVKE